MSKNKVNFLENQLSPTNQSFLNWIEKADHPKKTPFYGHITTYNFKSVFLKTQQRATQREFNPSGVELNLSLLTRRSID